MCDNSIPTFRCEGSTCNEDNDCYDWKCTNNVCEGAKDINIDPLFTNADGTINDDWFGDLFDDFNDSINEIENAESTIDDSGKTAEGGSCTYDFECADGLKCNYAVNVCKSIDLNSDFFNDFNYAFNNNDNNDTLADETSSTVNSMTTTLVIVGVVSCVGILLCFACVCCISIRAAKNAEDGQNKSKSKKPKEEKAPAEY